MQLTSAISFGPSHRLDPAVSYETEFPVTSTVPVRTSPQPRDFRRTITPRLWGSRSNRTHRTVILVVDGVNLGESKTLHAAIEAGRENPFTIGPRPVG